MFIHKAVHNLHYTDTSSVVSSHTHASKLVRSSSHRWCQLYSRFHPVVPHDPWLRVFLFPVVSHPSIQLSSQWFIHPFIYLSIHPTIYPFIHLFIYPTVHPSIHPLFNTFLYCPGIVVELSKAQSSRSNRNINTLLQNNKVWWQGQIQGALGVKQRKPIPGVWGCCQRRVQEGFPEERKWKLNFKGCIGPQ